MAHGARHWVLPHGALMAHGAPLGRSRGPFAAEPTLAFALRHEYSMILFPRFATTASSNLPVTGH
jgi:hypothetical protein